MADSSRQRRAEALERFERQTAIPMLVLALTIIPLLVAPLMFELSETTRATFVALGWFIWAAFTVEYAVRLYLSPNKGKFIRSNLIDLVVIVLPFLRPLRVLRSARALRVLRAARAAAFVLRGLDAARDVLTRHKLHYALLVAGLSVVAAALMVESFERDVEGSNIQGLPDALWWALVTVTTVGYGDRFPVTAGGRGVAVVLMIMGIGLFGLLAGSLASFFIQKEETEPDPQLTDIQERLERIERSLQTLEGDRSDENQRP
jgi:voltage-gated potassium channel